MSYIPIETLYNNIAKGTSFQFAQGIMSIQDKGYSVWTEKGWTSIRYIKRHFVYKEMFNVLTTHGHVIVTGDHSLVKSDGEETTAKQVMSGNILMHCNIDNVTLFEHSDNDVFCSVFLTLRCYYYASELRASCKGLDANSCLIEVKRYLSPHGCKVELYGSVLSFSRDDWYREKFMTGTSVKFPNYVYEYTPDNCRYFMEVLRSIITVNSGMLSILKQSTIYCLQSRLTGVVFNYEKTWDMYASDISPYVVSVVPLGKQPVVVYDLDTCNSHFAVGPGNLIVHNSCMVSLPQIKENSDCQYWGELIAQVMSGWKVGDPLPGYGYRSDEYPDKVHTTSQKGVFKSPMGIEYEKGMDMLSFCKKFYAYFVINPDGSYKCDKSGNRVIENKGIVTAKRGIEKHLTNYYRKCLYNVLTRHSKESTMRILFQCVREVMDGEVSNSDLEKVATVPTFKKAETHLVRFTRRMAAEGIPLVPGDKFGYVIAKGEGKIGDKMRLTEKCEEELDYNHYVTNVLAKPLSTLFNVSYFSELEKLQHVTYTPNTRERATGLSKIILTMYRWYRDGHSEEDFFKFVEEDSALPKTEITVVRDPYEALAIAMKMEKKKMTANRKKNYVPLYIDNGPIVEKKRARAPKLIDMLDLD
jgi:hypothetical protein